MKYRYKIYDDETNKLVGRAQTATGVSKVIRQAVKRSVDKLEIFNADCVKDMVYFNWADWLNCLDEGGLPCRFRTVDTTIKGGPNKNNFR